MTIALHCPHLDCPTTWLRYPEGINQAIDEIAQHTVTAHHWELTSARCDVREVNATAITQAEDEMRDE